MQSTNSQIQSFKNPQEYNQYLVNSNTEISMIDYVDKLNDMFTILIYHLWLILWILLEKMNVVYTIKC